MGSLVVIVGQASGKGCPAGEAAATKLDAPVLLENRALQPLDEAVGPGMAGLGARVADAELSAGLIERPLELAAAVCEHALQGPAGAPIGANALR